MPTRRATAAALALCAIAYLYVFPYQPQVNNPNENVRFYMTAAIVEHGTYAIDAIRERWGWVNDAAHYDGHYYSVKAPGTTLIAVPFYAAYHYGSAAWGSETDREVGLWICRISATILPTLLFLFFFHRFLGRFTGRAWVRDTVFFTVALGSMLYGYGLMFVSHTTCAAAACSAFMVLREIRERRRATAAMAFVGGLLTAGVTFLEYPGIVISLPLGLMALWAIRPRKCLLAFALGGILPTLAVMHFQYHAFDNPFTPGHLYMESEGFRAAHAQGLYGATGFSAEAAWRLLFDGGAGLFPLSPVLVFGLWGFVVGLRNRATRALTLFALVPTALTYLAIASMNNWRGGWTIGPRHIAQIVPFVAWAAVLGLDRLAARWPRPTAGVALGATVVGFVASGLPSAYYPHLPPELARPVPELFAVLVGHDYAPHNLGNALGLFGTASMIPLAIAATASLLLIAKHPDLFGRGQGQKGLFTVAAALIASVPILLVPILVDPAADTPPVKEAVAFVTRTFQPAGHDRAARLEQELRATPDGPPERFRELADLYFREGRDREAHDVIRRSTNRHRTRPEPQ